MERRESGPGARTPAISEGLTCIKPHPPHHTVTNGCSGVRRERCAPARAIVGWVSRATMTMRASLLLSMPCTRQPRTRHPGLVAYRTAPGPGRLPGQYTTPLGSLHRPCHGMVGKPWYDDKCRQSPFAALTGPGPQPGPVVYLSPCHGMVGKPCYDDKCRVLLLCSALAGPGPQPGPAVYPTAPAPMSRYGGQSML